MDKIDRRNLNNFIIETNNRKFRVEAIFIDLDGTLLDKWPKRISKKNLISIKKQQQTTSIIISTGRSYGKKVKKIMQLLDVEYAICQNGAIVVNKNGEILKNITLDKEQVERVIDIVKEEKLGFTINSEFLIYTDHWLWTTFTFLWRKKWKKIKKYSFKENNVNKIVVAGYLKSKKVWNLANKMQQTIKYTSIKTSGQDKIVEITHENATKGEAALFVANLLKIDINNTIHIGDSENDSTTKGKVGALFAMKDGSTKLIDLASHLGPKHKRGGVAKLLDGDFIELKNH